MSQNIHLIVADDHTIVREGLVALLEDEPDIKVVAQAGTGREALALIRRHQPDIALLDITMPGLNGLETTRQIKTEMPAAKILILTMHEEEAFFFEALWSGAAGYVLKGAGSEELLNAIRVIHQGGVYLPSNLVGSLVRDYLELHPQPAPDDLLTSSEQKILALIAQGLTNREIAKRLTLSINTVKTHRLHVYQKLDLHDRAALIDYALRHGLLRP